MFAVALGSLVFAFGHPLLGRLGTAGVARDWDYSLLQQWAPHETVTRYHQMPLWNPWACGGMPLLATPPSRFLTPWFALGLLTDPVTAAHLVARST